MCCLNSSWSQQHSISWDCLKHLFLNSPLHGLTEKYNHLLLYIVFSGRLYRHHGWHITGNRRKAKLKERTFSTLLVRRGDSGNLNPTNPSMWIVLIQLPKAVFFFFFPYLSSNSAKRLSKCRSASRIRSVYKLRSLRAWSLVMLRTSSRLRVRSLARGLMAILSISLFMMMEPAAKHYTGRFMP